MITKMDIVSTIKYHIDVIIGDYGKPPEIYGIEEAADELLVLIKQKESEIEFPEPE